MPFNEIPYREIRLTFFAKPWIGMTENRGKKSTNPQKKSNHCSPFKLSTATELLIIKSNIILSAKS